MPAWLIAALKMITGGALLGLGAEAGQALAPFGVPQGLEGQAFTGQGALSASAVFDPITGRLVKRRRRRRRALTASDRADIAFIAGILGPKAGKDIAAIIAART